MSAAGCLAAVTVLANCLYADGSGEPSNHRNIALVKPQAHELPLPMYGFPVGTKRSLTLNIVEVAPEAEAFLYLAIRDLDESREARVTLNDQSTLTLTKAFVSESDVRASYMRIPVEMLQVGKNFIAFSFADDLGGTTQGYFVEDLELWLGGSSQMVPLLESKINSYYAGDYKRPSGATPYQYTDDFEDEAEGAVPSHWLVKKGNWRVSGSEEKSLAIRERQPESHAVLHLFAQDVVFEGRITVREFADNGAVWFVVRYNVHPNYLVQAGYNSEEGVWQIRESFHKSVNLIKAQKQGHLPREIWHHVKLVVQGPRLQLYVNGQLECSTDQLRNLNYGKIGLYAHNARVIFDDIRYCGSGRVQDGVYVFYKDGFGNGDMVLLKNRELLLVFDGKERFCVSGDAGRSWRRPDYLRRFFDRDVCGNIARLSSGVLLNIRHNVIDAEKKLYRHSAHVSHDEGKTWEGPHWLESEAGGYLTMNGKHTQISSGRIFFPTSTTGGGMKAEEIGGIAVWYSDDEGRHWQQADHCLDQAATGLNLQEGEIVELSDGTLKLFARTPYGFLYETTSGDGGQTWDMKPQPTVFRSTMCAFNIWKDTETREIFIFWTYEDTDKMPVRAQLPRTRIALASSRDDTKTWQFLADVDDFKGENSRFMNLGLYVTDRHVFTMVNIFGLEPLGAFKDFTFDRALLKVTRLERDKLTPYPEFPPLH